MVWKELATHKPTVVDASHMTHHRGDTHGGWVAPEQLDEDGRMRSIYKFTTEAGRLASAKNPMGTGMNAQNQDRKLRYLYIPDRRL